MMTNSITDIQSDNIVCVHIDYCYDESSGAYNVYHLFNLDTKEFSYSGGMYSMYEGSKEVKHYSLTLDKDIAIEASKAWLKTAVKHDGLMNDKLGYELYKGCTVKLSRSRKAPNNTPLLVVADTDSEWNGELTPMVVVLVDNREIQVSIGCIKEVVDGVYDYPVWYVHEEVTA